MKLAFLLLVLLSSCGGDYPAVAPLGEVRTFNPILMNETEKTRLTSICTAISTKTDFLFPSGSSNYSFAVQEKRCGVAVTASPVTVPVILEPPAMVFSRTDVPAASFVFPQVETRTTGVMSSICADLTRPTSPRLLSGRSVWISTTQTADCIPGPNEICLLMESGPDQGNDQVKITTQEWMKFNILPGTVRTGFWTARQLTSSDDCTSPSTTLVNATLL